MEKINYKLVTTEQELEGALAVRREVFIEEQRIPPEIELDEHVKSGIKFKKKLNNRVFNKIIESV